MQRKKLLIAATLTSAILVFCAPCARSQSYQVIHNFGAPGGSGVLQAATNPYAGMIFDQQGNLFGTTEYGGSFNPNSGCAGAGCGTVYELSPNGSGGWREKILYAFTFLYDMADHPTAPVVFDQLGNLYGVANCPQDCFFGYGGVVFKLTPSNGSWTESVVYTESGPSGCGGNFGTGSAVSCSVAVDHGHLYGLTVIGGPGSCYMGCGTLYSLEQRSISQYDYLLDYAFRGGADGSSPQGLLAFDAAGNIYGTTGAGGSANAGTVYMLTRNQRTFGWTETVLHSFQGGTADGANPIAGVVLDSAGNIYGTTAQGGTAGQGTVYLLSPQPDGTWEETLLYSFQGGNDAAAPNSTLAMDAAGNLYGTAGGGANSQGTVFKLTHSGGQWTESLLHSFTGGLDGGQPSGGVTLDSSGNVFGTASEGGAYADCRHPPVCGGVAFEITP
jgi:uncharacterized repeat protein (TIGR03803 family)